MPKLCPSCPAPTCLRRHVVLRDTDPRPRPREAKTQARAPPLGVGELEGEVTVSCQTMLARVLSLHVCVEFMFVYVSSHTRLQARRTPRV